MNQRKHVSNKQQFYVVNTDLSSDSGFYIYLMKGEKYSHTYFLEGAKIVSSNYLKLNKIPKATLQNFNELMKSHGHFAINVNRLELLGEKVTVIECI